ncbi:hypothetical protein [Halobacteriovorax sp. RZ-3]|uniref:hypothetical protein n=2 Tax=unclassified Halobacteriovorax TaxID=2639665 RepID=UPI0037201134
MSQQLIVKVFYSLTFSFISYFLFDLTPIDSNENWFKSLILWVYPFKTILIPSLVLIPITIGCINDFKTKHFRIAYSLVLMVLIALMNGADFDHDLFLWFYISVVIALIPDKKILNTSKLLITLAYFMSGFWKLYYGVIGIFSDDLNSYLNFSGLKSIVLKSNPADWISVIPSSMFFIAGILVLLIELSGLVLYFQNKYYLKYWAQVMIVFHMLTVVFMKIEFVGNVVLISLVFADLLVTKKEQSSPYPHTHTEV